MSFLQALIYFVVEAASGLWRGWKASMLAVLTICVSLLIWGAFLLAGQNLGRTIERWRGEARLIVYLSPGADEDDRLAVETLLLEAPWVDEIRQVSSTDAQERFHQAFPSLDDLLEGWSESPLPASFEVTLQALGHGEDQIGSWVEKLRSQPGIDMVDDDRDWISQLEAVAKMAQTIGLVIGLVLLGAATFTIASVVRLNAFLYQDEISIMRLVGATEFLIRGPFYFEGLLEGLLGGLLAAAGLFLAHAGLLSAVAGEGVLVDLLLREFLPWPKILGLIAIGAVAGLAGAVMSLKGEALSLDET